MLASEAVCRIKSPFRYSFRCSAATTMIVNDNHAFQIIQLFNQIIDQIYLLGLKSNQCFAIKMFCSEFDYCHLKTISKYLIVDLEWLLVGRTRSIFLLSVVFEIGLLLSVVVETVFCSTSSKGFAGSSLLSVEGSSTNFTRLGRGFLLLFTRYFD